MALWNDMQAAVVNVRPVNGKQDSDMVDLTQVRKCRRILVGLESLAARELCVNLLLEQYVGLASKLFEDARNMRTAHCLANVLVVRSEVLSAAELQRVRVLVVLVVVHPFSGRIWPALDIPYLLDKSLGLVCRKQVCDLEKPLL
ncbi:hypothetical protein LPJ71_005176, partial [Coemansia sp. S17]